MENLTIKAICSSVNRLSYIEILSCAHINVLEATEAPGQTIAQVEIREIRRNQREDDVIGKWDRAVMDKKLPGKYTYLTKEDQIMKQKFKTFKMVRRVLYREEQDKVEKILLLVLPSCYRETVLRGLHSGIGHPGKDRTLSLLRERFFLA